jgi:uncharacterized protein (TIGR00251 family)
MRTAVFAMAKRKAGCAAKPAVAAMSPPLPVFARVVKGCLELRLHVVPGASTTEIVGEHGHRLRVRVAAPPEKGKANEAICDLLEEELGVKGITVVAGHGCREKTVVVPGLTVWPLE